MNETSDISTALRDTLDRTLVAGGSSAGSWPDVVEAAARRRARRSRLRMCLAVAIAVVVVVGGATVAVTLGADEDRSTVAVRATGRSTPVVKSVAPPDGRGRCLEVTVHAVSETSCVRLPGEQMWRIGGEDFLVAGSPITLADGQVLKPDASGFVVVPFRDYEGRLAYPGPGDCLSVALSDAVEATLGPRPPMFMATGCSPNYTWVDTEYYDRSRTEVLLFERRDGKFVHIANVDFGNPDRVERCSVLSDAPPPDRFGLSARAYCLLLGA